MSVYVLYDLGSTVSDGESFGGGWVEIRGVGRGASGGIGIRVHRESCPDG